MFSWCKKYTDVHRGHSMVLIVQVAKTKAALLWYGANPASILLKSISERYRSFGNCSYGTVNKLHKKLLSPPLAYFTANVARQFDHSKVPYVLDKKADIFMLHAVKCKRRNVIKRTKCTFLHVHLTKTQIRLFVVCMKKLCIYAYPKCA